MEQHRGLSCSTLKLLEFACFLALVQQSTESPQRSKQHNKGRLLGTNFLFLVIKVCIFNSLYNPTSPYSI